jgi:hypothetical protein
MQDWIAIDQIQLTTKQVIINWIRIGLADNPDNNDAMK